MDTNSLSSQVPWEPFHCPHTLPEEEELRSLWAQCLLSLCQLTRGTWAPISRLRLGPSFFWSHVIKTNSPVDPEWKLQCTFRKLGLWTEGEVWNSYTCYVSGSPFCFPCSFLPGWWHTPMSKNNWGSSWQGLSREIHVPIPHPRKHLRIWVGARGLRELNPQSAASNKNSKIPLKYKWYKIIKTWPN